MKQFRHFILLFISLYFPAFTYAQNFAFDYNGIARNYILHLPAGYNASNKHPLVLNFHGLTGSSEQQQAYSQMDKVSDAENFIVVYPNGLNKSWNAGINNGNVDDVGFINALLDFLISKYSIDANRIYSTGFSMGGFFSYKLACELNNRIAAIAPVAGSMTGTNFRNCNPQRAVPVLHIHGTNDGTVSYSGSFIFEGTENVLKLWIAHNDCSNQKDTIHLPNVNTTDNSTVDLIRYQDCADNAQVWFYKIYNGGHTWPNGLVNVNGATTNRDLNASQEIWNFFEQFSMPVLTGTIEDKNILTFTVFPNPATESITINTQDEINSFVILDVSGKVLREDKLYKGKSIDLSAFEKGTYLLRVINSAGQETSKMFLKL